MWAYIEREFRIAARSWEVLTSVLLIASALGLVFGDYTAGLVAANLVASALYSYVQILREEELGTLDGLRLLGQPEKVVGAKFLVLFSISLAASSSYSAIHIAASMKVPELWIMVPTAMYFAAAAAASALFSTAAKSGVTLSMTLTAALVLGYSASLTAGRLDPAVLAMPLAALLALLALSRVLT